MIEFIDEQTITKFWQQLWPDHNIRSMSSMLYQKGHDTSIYNRYKPTFIGFTLDGNVVGVNSGHRTSQYDYRSRGLYVLPEFRKLGIAQHLLRATIEQADIEDCYIVWSLPRQESLPTYERAGFIQTSDFFKTDTSNSNCYAIYNIDD